MIEIAFERQVALERAAPRPFLWDMHPMRAAPGVGKGEERVPDKRDLSHRMNANTGIVKVLSLSATHDVVES